MSELPEPKQPDGRVSDTPSADLMRAALERQLVEPPSEAMACVPPPIPDHELLHRIGSGAYGEVWLARSALGTLRAVKLVYRARFKEDRPYEREFNGILKYEPISRSHEGLVQVLHVGRDEGRACFYYVMELADAVSGKAGEWVSENKAEATHSPTHPRVYSPRTLRSELAQRPRLSPTEAAELVLRLASALGHLHAHGLVHRDIKPSNVIFVNGQPKLADIGLVTDVGSSHSFVGTEGFIPPEGPGTPQADLYGLGKLLYELATGHDRMEFPQLPPLASETRKAGGRNRQADALLELNEVMTRACAPEPRHRYTSASEMQADLSSFLAGRSLRRARHLELHMVRLKRFSLAACVFLALAAGSVWYAKIQEGRAKQRASVESNLRRRAEAAEQETQRQLFTALFEQARTTVRSGEVGQRVRALDALRRAAAISNTIELRREALRALAIPDLRLEKEIPTGPQVNDAELDPDFSRVALCFGDGSVLIRAVGNNRLLAALTNSAVAARYARWSSDGRYLAILRRPYVTNAMTDLDVWDLATVQRTTYRRDVRGNSVAFHPQRPELMVPEGEGGLTIVNVATGEAVTQHGLPKLPSHFAYSPDGKKFAVTFGLERGHLVSVRDATRNTRVINLEMPTPPVSFAWHPTGRWLAIAVQDGRMFLADVVTGFMDAMGRHKAPAISAVFSPGGDYLFSCDTDGDWVCWAFSGMQVQFTVGGQSFSLQFSRDGRQCAVGTMNSLKLYSFERPACERELICAIGECTSAAAFSPDGRWVAVYGDQAKIGVWDLSTNAVPTLRVSAANAVPFFSENSSMLFLKSHTNFAIWPLDMYSDQPVPTPMDIPPFTLPSNLQSAEIHSNRLVITTTTSVEFIPLASSATNGVRSFPMARGQGTVSPDGRWYCLRPDFSQRIEVFQLPEMKRVCHLTNSSMVVAAAFSPRGDELAVGTRLGVIFLETATWRRTRELAGELGLHAVIRFAPDGQTFWLNRDLRNAALYDTETLKERLVLPNGLLPLAIDRSGQRLLISVDGRRLQVWNLASMREHFRELGMDWAAFE